MSYEGYEGRHACGKGWEINTCVAKVNDKAYKEITVLDQSNLSVSSSVSLNTRQPGARYCYLETRQKGKIQ